MCSAYSNCYITITHKIYNLYVSRRNEIDFCMSCYRGHSTGHINTKTNCLAQFLTELRIANSIIQKCFMKNYTY